MISLIILIFLLATQVALNGYNYEKINVSDSHSGSDKADISRDLTLASAVLSASFIVFILLLYYFKFINYSRAEFLTIVSVIVIGIIMLISWHYLNLQYKSPASYDSAKDNLRDNSITVNEDELLIALSGGIVTLSIAVIIAGLLIGKYLIADKQIVRIKEPVYVNMQTTATKEDYKEPDYMSEVSKNFIV